MQSDISVVRTGWEWENNFAPAPGVRAGEFLFLSGNPPFDNDGQLVHPRDLLKQAEQIFSNIRDILAREDLGMDRIVKMTTFFTADMNVDDAQAFWALRKRFFGGHRPASIGVKVAGLLYPDMVIEIDAVAYLGGR